MYRKPSLLVHIRDEPSEAGKEGQGGDELVQGAELNEVIMRLLLEQGRLQAEQLILAVAGHLQQNVDDSRDNIQRHFLGLVQVGHCMVLAHVHSSQVSKMATHTFTMHVCTVNNEAMHFQDR